MNPRRTETMEALAGPLYAIALLLIATPILDFVSAVVPLRLDNIEWRFASVGLLSGFLLTPLLGIVLALLVADSVNHELFRRLIGFLLIGTAVLFAILLIFFLLDILQLRSVVKEESKSQFVSAAWKAVAKHALFIAVMAWLGWRVARLARPAVAQGKRPAAVMIG